MVEKPVVMVRLEGVLIDSAARGSIVRPGAIVFMQEVRRLSRAVVFSEVMSRSSILGWLNLWGVPHDDACNLQTERPPGVRAVVDITSIPIPANPGFREFDLTLARLMGLLLPAAEPPDCPTARPTT